MAISNIFNFLKRKPVKQVVYTRRFDAAKSTRLNMGWNTAYQDINWAFQFELLPMKVRARDLVQNNALINSYLQQMLKNIVGAEGIILKNKAQNETKVGFDAGANAEIENAWREFEKAPSISGTVTMKDFLRLCVESLVIDGELIIIFHEGFDNQHGFAMELMDSTWLDARVNVPQDQNGVRTVCGIQMDKYGRPMNYYFRPPFGSSNLALQSNYTVIPASRVKHIFTKKSVSAVRGYPELAPIMEDLKIMDDYIYCELVAARGASAKMGFIQNTGDVEYVPGVDEKGNPISVVEPGIIETLGPGQTFVPYDPKHPTTAFETFIKSITKTIAASLGISYGALTGDASDANYSSMRMVALSDRETYKTFQNMLIEYVLLPAYKKWLPIQMVNGNVNLPFSKNDRFHAPDFKAKKGKWVDPEKDDKANEIELALGINSRTKIAAEQGLDILEIFDELANEQKELDKRKIVLGDIAGKPKPNIANPAETPTQKAV